MARYVEMNVAGKLSYILVYYTKRQNAFNTYYLCLFLYILIIRLQSRFKAKGNQEYGSIDSKNMALNIMFEANE